MLNADSLGLLIWLGAVFDSLEIPYALGGSLASIRHGRVRNTNDADFVVDMPLKRVDEFVSMFDSDFYCDAQMVRDAIERRSSFNIIHLPTAFKLDIFQAQLRQFDKLQLKRRELGRIEGMSQDIWFVSAEDIILGKLHWYRLGGEQSERQLRDVLDVMRAQAKRLDHAYMREIAAALQVGDLLEIAIEKAGKLQ